MRTAALCLLLCAAPLRAESIDDSDISGGPLSLESLRGLEAEGRAEGRSTVFSLLASRPPLAAATAEVTGALQLADRQGNPHAARLARARLVGAGASAAWAPVDGEGRFALPAPQSPSGSYRVRLSLDNALWALVNPRTSGPYEWESPSFSLEAGAGRDLGALEPVPSSQNAKFGVLHLAYLEALDYLKSNGDIAWWKKPLRINIPVQGDFFSPWAWSLSLSNPLAWDVVLHELGHAVQHGAMKAAAAGGSHKIDECYNPALAWSEGWATFFAASVRLSRDDADAKFEFLVPRRAPIRIENVPEDVCRGQSSEWRVAAGLWDLLDTHPDGKDAYAMPFSVIWVSLRGKSMESMSSAWGLIAQNLDAAQRTAAENSLIENTLLPNKPALAAALPKPPQDWLDKAR